VPRSLEGHSSSTGKLAGRLWMFAAALLWSTSGLFAKAPLFDDWSLDVRGPQLAFWRAVSAGLVLLPLVRRPRWRPTLVPLTLCFTGMNLAYLTAMTLSTAANAIWLQSTAPWWVLLVAVLILREPVTRGDLVSLGFGLAGVGLILAFEIQGKGAGAVTLGLASGVAYAGVVVFMRRLAQENSAWLVAVSHLVAAAAILPWALWIGRMPTISQLAVLAAFGALQMALPYTFLVRALRSIGSQEAVLIGLVEPILMPLWVYLVWNEPAQPWTIAGALLILAGLLVRYLVVEPASRKFAAEDPARPK